MTTAGSAWMSVLLNFLYLARKMFYFENSRWLYLSIPTGLPEVVPQLQMHNVRRAIAPDVVTPPKRHNVRRAIAPEVVIPPPRQTVDRAARGIQWTTYIPGNRAAGQVQVNVLPTTQEFVNTKLHTISQNKVRLNHHPVSQQMCYERLRGQQMADLDTVFTAIEYGFFIILLLILLQSAVQVHSIFQYASRHYRAQFSWFSRQREI